MFTVLDKEKLGVSEKNTKLNLVGEEDARGIVMVIIIDPRAASEVKISRGGQVKGDVLQEDPVGVVVLYQDSARCAEVLVHLEGDIVSLPNIISCQSVGLG